MKNSYIIIIALLLSLNLFAQSPEKMSYQAVLRDANDALLVDANVGMQVSILQASETGNAVYVETQTPTTNTNGLVSIEVGAGTVVSGDFSTIDWSLGSYYIRTEVDPTGGTDYTIIGANQLLSVPYALFSKQSGGVTDTEWAREGDNIYNNNFGNVGIGTRTPTHSLEVTSIDTSAVSAIAVGHTGRSFNQIDSGELVFSENLADPTHCGIKFQLNGKTNELYLIGSCNPDPVKSDTIAGFNRKGNVNIQKLRIGSNISSDPTSILTVDGDIQVNGDINLTGNIAKGGGTFKIDHPLDPKNKYLIHSFVESPEMLNIYSGNVTTDNKGYVTVTLPSYFEAANKDFRYQLTTIGSFSQAIVKEKIENNMFIIQTSSPNVEVSWQVTAVRADKFADKNRIVPEMDKEIKGSYLHPDLYGADKESSESFQKSILNIKRSAKLKKTKNADGQ